MLLINHLHGWLVRGLGRPNYDYALCTGNRGGGGGVSSPGQGTIVEWVFHTAGKLAKGGGGGFISRPGYYGRVSFSYSWETGEGGGGGFISRPGYYSRVSFSYSWETGEGGGGGFISRPGYYSRVSFSYSWETGEVFSLKCYKFYLYLDICPREEALNHRPSASPSLR